jgi:exodeoxyribonuclease VII large subunit
VSELNRRARALLENQFETLWVAGELSGVKLATSGHWYFCLKDPGAQVDCAMFRTRAQFLDFRPENGMQVEVRARVTLYEPRGSYQLVVEELRKAGLGKLHEAFEKLKAKLGAEGLFEPERKKRLPAFPRAIGIVTSREAAALRDMLITLGRRAPMTPVILYPAPVQGEGAGAQIARAIRKADARAECDVLIVGRGGGSLEDLWAFNEEVVARAIADCSIPVVSGVGHETDFTIADFVADLRAPTPTAAAALVSPDRVSLWAAVADLRRRLARDLRRGVETRSQRLDALARRLLTPAQRLERERRASRSLRGACPRLRAAACRTAHATSPPCATPSRTSIPRACSRAATASCAMPRGTCCARAMGSRPARRSTSPSPRAARGHGTRDAVAVYWARKDRFPLPTEERTAWPRKARIRPPSTR